MELLTQYYNEGGQIVSKAPGMDTREFYRDVLFRHRFKEMFVAANESDGVRYSYTDDSAKIDFGNMYGGKKLSMHQDYYSPDLGGYVTVQGVPYSIVDGYGGRRAIRLETTENNNRWQYIGTSELPSNFFVRDFRIRMTAKSPTLISDSAYSYFQAYIEDAQKDSEDCSVFCALSLQAGQNYRNIWGYADTEIYKSYSNSGWSSDNSLVIRYTDGFMFDGDWHVYDLKVLTSGVIEVYADGNLLGSSDFGSPWVEGFHRPFIYLGALCPTGAPIFDMDSITVEAL